MTAPARTKPSTIDERFLRSIEIAATAVEWSAARCAMLTARSRCQDARRGVCGPMITKIDRLDDPAGSVSVKVCNFVDVAELLLIYGDDDAKTLGGRIVTACSNVVHGGGQDGS